MWPSTGGSDVAQADTITWSLVQRWTPVGAAIAVATSAWMGARSQLGDLDRRLAVLESSHVTDRVTAAETGLHELGSARASDHEAIDRLTASLVTLGGQISAVDKKLDLLICRSDPKHCGLGGGQ